MKWSLAWYQLRRIKHYIFASALVFLLGIVLGSMYSEQFQMFLNAQMRALDELIRSTEHAKSREWALFWVIFWNNATVALLIIAMGIFFGVFPLFALISNGLLLGYVASASAEKNSLGYMLKSVIPHGILELPAIIVAAAFGLRLGVLVLQLLVSMVVPKRSAAVREEFRLFMRSLVPVCVLLLLVLLAAAAIESTITFWLVRK
ncbi:stage II sporulation protein M [Paenibacillus ginsengihumi]|uniref:stage II sporulation protein M n=1 Tax=Paenibacillus ginsengihumi TaxID=431596 RepID=UPI0003735761|nr:stage II sporulation protein M [Paenibacillus ginsengihumi]